MTDDVHKETTLLISSSKGDQVPTSPEKIKWSSTSRPVIHIFHNILWSRYKGGVFSKLQPLAEKSGYDVKITQIAETEGNRVGLAAVDMSYHRYGHELLFKGTYEGVSTFNRFTTLFNRVFKTNADLVILPGYDRIEFWGMLLACVLTHKPRAVFCDSTAYDHAPNFLKGLAKRLFFSLCNGYFGYGQRSAEYLLSLGARKDRIFHRCQAAALPHDYSAEAALATRIEHAPSIDKPRFIYVGRLSEEKSLDVLMYAMQKVHTLMPTAELVLYGAGPQRAALEALASDLGVAGIVKFAGSASITDLAAAYASATAMILPSRSEPWGLVVNEALSYGCPVIVSHACGCVPELVLDGVTGHAFKTDDRAELAASIVRAPQEFSDVPRIAANCIALIGKYMPENAAQQILLGCKTILMRQ